MLLDGGARTDIATTSQKWTALDEAAGGGHIEVVKVLLGRGITRAIDAATGASLQWTALHKAASGGHIEVVKVLLDRTASTDATTSQKWTTLDEATGGGYSDIEVVKELLGNGASIDNKSHRKWEWAALHLAAMGGQIEVVELLLDRGASIDATNSEDWSALHWAAKGAILRLWKCYWAGAQAFILPAGRQLHSIRQLKEAMLGS